MKKSWNFPKYNFGRRHGISSTGIETFKGNRYVHLAKEICQNSLDAVKNHEKPVRVEFNKISVNREDIPDFDKYNEIINLCYEYNKYGDEKAKNYFENAKNILASKKISVLRVSDFNTKGLLGSKSEKDTPWHDLIKASGVSNKKGSDGGSFGIGKYAAFACSNLNTVFYNTFDMEGVRAYQGISELTNYIDKNGIEREGEGYYGIGQENNPIFENFSLDKDFHRLETGTDVYIIGFLEKKDWVESIVYSIVDSFLISIYNNKLEVLVDDILINKDRLDYIINEYIKYNKSSRVNTPQEFYKILTSNKKFDEYFNLESADGVDLGRFRLMFLIGKEFNSRKILMSRINGMKIFEQDRFPAGIPFSGICILKDEEINKYFRKMETPQHDAWNAELFSQDMKEINDANETRLKLIRIIRDELRKEATVTTLDESDVEGLGSYLPDYIDNEELLKGTREKEGLNTPSKDTEVSIKIENDYEKTKTKKVDQEEIREGGYDISTSEESYPGGKPRGRNASGESNLKPGNLKGDYKFKVRRMSDLGNVRIFNREKDINNYRLIFTPDIDIENFYIELNVLGEDYNTKEVVGIEYAYLVKERKTAKIIDNKIYIQKIDKGKRLILEILPKIKEQLSMEVIIYEND